MATYSNRSAGFAEVLENLKTEFENMEHEVNVFKIQRDEYEKKLEVQIQEVCVMQQLNKELERQHTRMKQQYEEEILSLRQKIVELGGDPNHAHKKRSLPPNNPPNTTSTTSTDPHTTTLRPTAVPSASDEPTTKRPKTEVAEENHFTVSNQLPFINAEVQLKETLQHDDVVCCVQLSPCGKFIATGTKKMAIVWRTCNGSKAAQLNSSSRDNNTKGSDSPPIEDHYVRSLCFSPVDSNKVVINGSARTVLLFNVDSGTQEKKFVGHTADIHALAYSADGTLMISGSVDGTAVIWDAAQGTKKFSLTHQTNNNSNGGGGAGITSLAVHKDNVATGSLDCTVKIWSLSSGALLSVCKQDKRIYCVAFSANGQALATGSEDRTVRVWNTGKLAQRGKGDDNKVECPQCGTLEGHQDIVLSVDFSKDNQHLISAGRDATIGFWDWKSQKVQFTLQGHKRSVMSVHTGTEDNIFASAGGDSLARYWKYSITGKQPQIQPVVIS